MALECLRATENLFAELPAGITALLRLTELKLGRVLNRKDPMQLQKKRPLDVRALGDLSAFPALCKLTFECCEVLMCKSVLGAVRHASLASFSFRTAYPAPECALMVLQLGQEFKQLGRGSVLRFENNTGWQVVDRALQDVQGQAPLQTYMAALQARGL